MLYKQIGGKILNIKYQEGFNEKNTQLIDAEFNEFAIKNGLTCNYKPFNIIAEEEGEILGILIGRSYYNEVHVSELLVFEKYRYKNIGTKLMAKVEERYKNKGFLNITLNTYEFQAPEFYKKCGFQIEFIRQNKDNSKLNKYFFVKYF